MIRSGVHPQASESARTAGRGCPSPVRETTRYRDRVPDVIDLLSRVTGSMAGGEERPGQLEMAAIVADAVAGGSTVLVEAGTGTGKSLRTSHPRSPVPIAVIATATIAPSQDRSRHPGARRGTRPTDRRRSAEGSIQLPLPAAARGTHRCDPHRTAATHGRTQPVRRDRSDPGLGTRPQRDREELDPAPGGGGVECRRRSDPTSVPARRGARPAIGASPSRPGTPRPRPT